MSGGRAEPLTEGEERDARRGWAVPQERWIATLDAERQRASEVSFDAKAFAAVVVQRDAAIDSAARLRSQLLAERAARSVPDDMGHGCSPKCDACKAAERAARDGAHKPDVTPLGTSCIECGEHWPCSAARDGGLREAVVEYLAADDDMPEFADAQRMDSAEWDRRNRRWAAADVALKDALASPAPALDARLAVAEAAFDWGGHECDHAGYCAGCAALHAAIDRHDRFSSGAAPREGEGQ